MNHKTIELDAATDITLTSVHAIAFNNMVFIAVEGTTSTARNAEYQLQITTVPSEYRPSSTVYGVARDGGISYVLANGVLRVILAKNVEANGYVNAFLFYPTA